MERPEKHICEDVYDIYADDEFMASFTNNCDARCYLEHKVNQQGWTIDRFRVHKANHGQMTLSAVTKISIGGQ